jgi:hypothetical protein
MSAADTASGGQTQFSVDAWDVGYGSALSFDEAELPPSAAQIKTDVEVPESRWAAVPPVAGLKVPSAVLFVDGVRRIDARVWIEDPFDAFDSPGVPDASMGLCASYSAGVVCCCDLAGHRQAHLVAAGLRRGLFTVAPYAGDIRTRRGSYRAMRGPRSDGMPLAMTLSIALQKALAELEVETASRARAGSALKHEAEGASSAVGELDDDLLVIDGPLRDHGDLKRALGYIKTHRAEYLPSTLNTMVGALEAGQRSPVFRMGTSWERYAWYLRLPSTPGVPGAPWAGVVRCEAATEVSDTDAIALANLSQTVLCRYASATYKDPRAPQNLVPIGGLEATLRHRLGDARLMYRALREAACT